MARRVVVVTAALGLALLAGSPVSAQANGASIVSKVQALKQMAKKRGKVRVMARIGAGNARVQGIGAMRGLLLERARGLRAEAVKELGNLDWVAMTVDEAALDAMVAEGLVADVVEDRLDAPTLASTIPLIGADQSRGAGFTGNGWAVAVIDTGVDNDHVDLNVVSEACYSTTSGRASSACPAGAASSTAADSADGCRYAANGVSGCDHGTHVAGIAAGTNGVARDANIIAINVFSVITDNATDTPCADAGRTSPCMLSYTSDQVLGLQRVRALEASFQIASVNMSLGGDPVAAACDGSGGRTAQIDALFADGVATVASSGNDGSTNGVGAPACVTNAIAVGNTTDADLVSGSSNAGIMLDLWAPGTGVVSTVPGGQGSKSGTSMSSPHVAGAIAVLKQIDPTLTPTEALQLLQSTGVTVTDTRAGGSITRSRIDVEAAARQLSWDMLTSQTSDQMGSALASGDFNGDGFVDLAVGVPYQDVGTVTNAGSVDVYYGSQQGPGIAQVWTQSSPAILGGAEQDDRFGSAVAAGDFNGDGFDDLAIGVPYEDDATLFDVGMINVIYGGFTGLTSAGNQTFMQDSANIEDANESQDRLGTTLAVGDFNNDLRDDLAIGIPNENIGAIADAGATAVIYGAPTGLSATVVADQLWSQDSASIEDLSEANDHLGASLAVGDFNNDGRQDLAIGVPDEDVGAVSDAGAVNVVYGSTTGLHATTVADQFWTQNSAGVLDSCEPNERLGTSLSAGDFNNDGRDDLAMGVPFEPPADEFSAAGAVSVLYGASAAGLGSASNQFWSQDSANIEGAAEIGDIFGRTLVSGDFNNDQRADLAIGVVGEDSSSGAVNVIYGSATGLNATAVPDQIWTQNSAGIPGGAESLDTFGSALTSGDFNNDGRSDLAIGVPLEKVGTIFDAGSVNVIMGVNASGLGSAGSQILTE